MSNTYRISVYKSRDSLEKFDGHITHFSVQGRELALRKARNLSEALAAGYTISVTGTNQAGWPVTVATFDHTGLVSGERR
jgi:hypothetical protein